MFREIKKKRLILENRRPFSREAQRLIEEISKTEWVYTSIVLEGHSLTKNLVGKLIQGEFLPEASIGDHLLVNNLNDTINLISDMISLENHLSKGNMNKIVQKLKDEENGVYRESNPVLRMLEYNPPHFKEIENQMDLLFHRYHNEKSETNPLKLAAWLHNAIIEIYPYENHTELVARIAANYHLLNNDLPLVPWNMGEQEYYDAIKKYLKTEDSEPIYEMLMRSAFNSLEVMMQLTAE